MRRSPPKRSARAGALALALLALPAAAQEMPVPLTDRPGDPAAGRAVVAAPERGLCTLCHAGPFPEVPFQGDLGPDLAGVGARLSIPELRQRIVDGRALNGDTIMPPYHATDGLARVGARWRDTPILSAQEVEDVVAFLATLTEDTP